MSLLPAVPEVIRQILRKPATNVFPAKYLPPSIRGFLRKVEKGEAAIHPPIETPPMFRGKILYDFVRVRIPLVRPDLELAIVHSSREHAPMRRVRGKARVGCLCVRNFGVGHIRAFLVRAVLVRAFLGDAWLRESSPVDLLAWRRP